MGPSSATSSGTATAQALARGQFLGLLCDRGGGGNILAPDKTSRPCRFPPSSWAWRCRRCRSGAIARLHGRRGLSRQHRGRRDHELPRDRAVILGSFWLYCLAAFWAGPMRPWSSRSVSRRRLHCPSSAGRAMSFIDGGRGLRRGDRAAARHPATMDLWPPISSRDPCRWSAVAAVSTVSSSSASTSRCRAGPDRGRAAVE